MSRRRRPGLAQVPAACAAVMASFMGRWLSSTGHPAWKVSLSCSESRGGSDLAPADLMADRATSWATFSIRVLMLALAVLSVSLDGMVGVVGDVLQGRSDLPFLHALEPVQEFLDGGAGRQVSEQGCDRHSGLGEEPVAAVFAWVLSTPGQVFQSTMPVSPYRLRPEPASAG